MESSYNVKILEVEKITHDVLGIKTEKPTGYAFVPGQATEVAINDQEWINEKRPFTFTNLPGDDHLEFTIKTYPAHNGVTNRLLNLRPKDELIIHDVWGAIHYKGKGLFIAGGAGITPFISIFRYLRSINDTENNRLLFANKTKKDFHLVSRRVSHALQFFLLFLSHSLQLSRVTPFAVVVVVGLALRRYYCTY